jgi:hypothetical protein
MASMLGMCYILCMVIYMPGGGGGGGSQGGLEPPKKKFGLFLASERSEANREGSLYSFLVGFRN